MQVNQKKLRKNHIGTEPTVMTNKILELMHGKKKRLLSTVKAISVKGMRLPLTRVHPGFVSALCPLALLRGKVC